MFTALAAAVHDPVDGLAERDGAGFAGVAEPAAPACATHPGQPVISFRSADRALLCSQCIEGNGGDVAGTVALADPAAISAMQEELVAKQASLSEASVRILGNSEVISAIKTELRAECAAQETALAAQFSAVRAALDHPLAEATAALHKLRDARLKKLDAQLDDALVTGSQLDAASKIAGARFDDANALAAAYASVRLSEPLLQKTFYAPVESSFVHVQLDVPTVLSSVKALTRIAEVRIVRSPPTFAVHLSQKFDCYLC